MYGRPSGAFDLMGAAAILRRSHCLGNSLLSDRLIEDGMHFVLLCSGFTVKPTEERVS